MRHLCVEKGRKGTPGSRTGSSCRTTNIEKCVEIAEMCGIAGYSFHRASRVDRTLAAQALLAGIAERGADAAGYAYRGPEGDLVHKQQSGASALLDRLAIPEEANQAILHVRDYTKGHPTIEA